jgi:aldehyde dehydrogenase (NAD+)
MYVHHSVKAAFLDELANAIELLFGSDPLHNHSYTRIVSHKRFDRLTGFLSDGEVVIGGESHRDRLFIEPTVVTHIDWDCDKMQDEIFGPILPVLTYIDMEFVLEEVNARPKPLALTVRAALSYSRIAKACSIQIDFQLNIFAVHTSLISRRREQHENHRLWSLGRCGARNCSTSTRS